MGEIQEIGKTLPQTKDIVNDVRKILRTARRHAVRTINTDMVAAYWLIGKRIVIEEQGGESKAKYGEKLLQHLSASLETEFGNGFSYANLRNMRQFYMTYPDEQICYTLCINLPWSHNRLIMRVDDPDARQWYLQEAASQQWSVRQLERNIRSLYYQRMIAAGDTRDLEIAETKKYNTVRQFVKDPYVLEFVGLPPFPHHKEKPSKLTHRDVGQMDMYIRMFDDIKKGKDDNPTVGILLCADKDETIVKYSVLNDSQQMFAAKYLPYMPTEEELKQEIENSHLMHKELA